VHKNPRVVFLESREGAESLFTRGLRSGATACGWHPQVHFLADRDGVARPEKDVRIDLLKAHADAICFLMDAPLDLKNIWDAPSLAPVDKISLWFDDYYRSPKTLAHPEIWSDWQARHKVRVGIWDGYWRCQWKMLTGADAFPIHLAADPRQLRPGAEPWRREWSDRAVFIGTIPARKSLDEFAAAFPAHMRRFLEEICTAMNTASWPIRPYEIAQKARSFLPMRYTRAIDATLKDPGILALWNHLLWRWGKRIARLRGLAAVAQAGPLAVLSGHQTEVYADEAEIRAALPQRADFVYADTKNVPSQQWGRLFRTGKFQVQITDPQSIEGGLPFRVFECGASAVPLLSDHRTELAALYPAGTGIFTAIDEPSLQLVATQMFQMSRRELDKQGQALHEDFLTRHTWEIRWRQLMEGRELRSQASPFTRS
jgi:spore maturation protein CgeB